MSYNLLEPLLLFYSQYFLKYTKKEIGDQFQNGECLFIDTRPEIYFTEQNLGPKTALVYLDLERCYESGWGLVASFRVLLSEMNKFWFLLTLGIWHLNNYIWAFRPEKLFLRKSCVRICYESGWGLVGSVF